jgi:hypothetical protein
MRMRASIGTVLVLVLAFSNGCKKDTAIVATEPQATAQSATCNDYESYYGIVQNYGVVNNTLQAQARTSSVKLISYCKSNPYQLGPVGVSLSSLQLNSQNLSYFYDFWLYSFDTLPQTSSNSFIWSIGGSNGYPTFTETNTDSFPRFTKYDLLPDSIDRNGVTSIQLGTANASGISVYFDNVQGRLPFEYYPYGSDVYFVSSPNTTTASSSLTFSYNTQMGSESTTSLVVSCAKGYSKTIDNKPMQFFLRSVYKKKIYFRN